MKRMARLVKHRGPDDYGEFVDAGVALFNDRLSIIDLEGGRQPIFNEDETIVVVYNGEIYNFPELRQGLQEKGHSFKTRCDTEVIVHGYEEFGASVFSMLNGMFAIALWDRRQKRLFLARDRVGIKPLYYAPLQQGLVFCSEIKGIISHPEIVPSVDKYALYTLMSLSYIPFELTLFKGIFKIPPGHYYDSQGGIVQYWAPPSADGVHAPDPALVRKVVEDSVRRQLISDVQVGSFLSGGLDTSTLVAFASKHYRGRLRTFCMGFGHEDDELADARLVAEHFGTEHYDFTISDRATLELYPKMIWHSEQPKLNTYGWFVNEFASRYVKVCLSGLGGDELFFGYPTSSRFVSFQRAQRLMRIPGIPLLSRFAAGKRKHVLLGIRNRAHTYLTVVSSVYGPEDHDYFALPKEEVQDYHTALTGRMDESFFQNSSEFLQQTVNAEFHTKLPDDYLVVEDAMSMAHSLENRVPLLDNALVDLMLPVSYRSNYANDTGKMLLRRAMEGILPRRCFEKPKQGFSLNIVKWWEGELGEEVRRMLPESPSVRQFFNIDKLKQLAIEARGSYGKISLLWYIYAFHVWHDLFIERGKQNVDLLVLPVH